MSGLTVGLLGIDELELEIKLYNGTQQEKINSEKIINIIRHHHWLLVTLLLANSIAIEAIPVFLDELFDAEITIAISVGFVLAFGEVLPQSLCTGPNQMKIAIKMVPLVKGLMILFFPIAFPIAKLLDCILDNKEWPVTLKTDDLKAFISLHESFNKELNGYNGGLEKFQIAMMHGIIDLNKIKVKQFMRPYNEYLSLNIEAPITKAIVDSVIGSSYYILPIFKGTKSNLIGAIKVQELFRISEGEKLENLNIFMTAPIFIIPTMSLLTALKLMDAAQVTISFVVQEFNVKKKIIGVITTEIILSKIFSSKHESERFEISDISQALAGSIGNALTLNGKKTKAQFKESLL